MLLPPLDGPPSVSSQNPDPPLSPSTEKTLPLFFLADSKLFFRLQQKTMPIEIRLSDPLPGGTSGSFRLDSSLPPRVPRHYSDVNEIH